MLYRVVFKFMYNEPNKRQKSLSHQKQTKTNAHNEVLDVEELSEWIEVLFVVHRVPTLQPDSTTSECRIGGLS